MKFSKINTCLLIVIVFWAVLAIIFGFTDLNISIAVVDSASTWGNFGADYGEAPGYGLIAIALATFFGSYIKDVKKQKILGFIGVFVGILIIILTWGDNVSDQALGWTLVVSLLAYIIYTWNKDWKNYKKIASVISLLAVINPLIIVQVIKVLWGRVRFRDLAVDYSNFTPWFIPNGITGNHSFPSGHAAMGIMFLPLLILVKDRKNSDPIKILTYLLVIGWALFVAFSRVVVGAHYASDVLFSIGIGTVTTILLYKKFYDT